jgi:mono/diheme cytochrome c family protein
MRWRLLTTVPTAATLWLFVQACTAPGGPDHVKVGFPAPDAAPPSGDGGVTLNADLQCVTLSSSQMYPPRSSVTSGQASGSAATYFTADLFSRFKTICGGCHVDNSIGNFTVSASDFPEKVKQMVVDQITGKDTTFPYMPPASAGFPPYSQRSPSDPVVRLVQLLQEWIDQKSPSDSFVDHQSQANQGSAAAYVITPDMGAKMTNIGTCVPGKGMVGTSLTAMDDKDAFFASATELPHTLDQTDLVTLDSEELAKDGVISFAPTYPLWTENAGKMRYVRVPRGQSITFDKKAQQFHIPPNTRFYKTFLKQVIDTSGHASWRKMETRVIVSRPDENGPDGHALKQTALYGTYIWSDDETTATLLDDPLRNGQPFADRIVTYITDEQKAQAIADTKPDDLQRALSDAGLIRHYAFPGARRCVDCHMGSVSQSFILGFTPLQLNRRPWGAGGLYEPATGDELTQLERLIAYGVISGMTSPDDVLPLELSEGTRAARTPEELAAQAYMMGNCAHCHNPRGLPLVKEPLLVDKVNFFPSTTGGIFQFPLDRMSPIRFRGLNQDTPVPYITPSLYDLPVGRAELKGFCPQDPQAAKTGAGDCYKTGDLPTWIFAPWRSLIYRNVDTPFDYFEDYLPFPHMPMHSPGFDCRVPGIMGDWMVSIPAKLIDTKTREDAYISSDHENFINANEDNQPYREVTPDSPDYPAAVSAARDRLKQYHAGPRYNFCPSTYTDDIVDAVVQAEVDQHSYVEADLDYFTDPNDPTKLTMPILQVPVRPNYIPFDDTDPPGDWFPRNPLWNPGIVDSSKIPTVVKETITNGDAQATEDLTNVLEEIQNVKLTDDLRKTLLQQVPMGLWDTSKPNCNFSGVPKASDPQFAGSAHPDWMDVANAPPAAPVYVESAGAAVFTTICYNCHGVQADSKGLLADAIVNFTGGDARVANFRDGLFGPVSDPGAHRTRVFKDFAINGITPDDLAVRYMAYMALGGTQKHLPLEVLHHVAAAPVFGKLRANLAQVGSPDMLQVGLTLCEQLASAFAYSALTPKILVSDLQQGRIRWSQYTGLIDTSGDAEMWLKLCTLGNRPLVHVVDPGPWIKMNSDQMLQNITSGELVFSGASEYWGDAMGSDNKPLYPADAPVMDHHGRLHQGITADNPFPICVKMPTDPAELEVANKVLGSIAVGGPGGTVIPPCPTGFVTDANKLDDGGTAAPNTFPDARKWAARGAINAAMAVFLYLDDIERHPENRKPLYNQCDQLGAATP